MAAFFSVGCGGAWQRPCEVEGRPISFSETSTLGLSGDDVTRRLNDRGEWQFTWDVAELQGAVVQMSWLAGDGRPLEAEVSTLPEGSLPVPYECREGDALLVPLTVEATTEAFTGELEVEVWVYGSEATDWVLVHGCCAGQVALEGPLREWFVGRMTAPEPSDWTATMTLSGTIEQPSCLLYYVEEDGNSIEIPTHCAPGS